MSNVSDIAKGRAKRPLGSPSSGEAPAEGWPTKVKLDPGDRLVGTLISKSKKPSTYTKPDGSPQPDVHYYTLEIAEDTGLTVPVTNEAGKITGVEPIGVGTKVSIQGKGDLNEQMAEAEPGMLLEIEFTGTHKTSGGFNFSNFLVSELV